MRGFVVQYGTDVSHAAILAKSFGIPVMRVACLACVTRFADRSVLVWDGGEVPVQPDEAELAACRPPAQAAPIEALASRRGARVWISIVDPEQLETVDRAGVEGMGLYRSDSLFLRYSERFPSEEEQYATSRRLFELAAERPVAFRTVDLGADKPVAHMHLGPQENPCLGLRAHRLFRFHPEILLTQVRAVLRAAQGDHRLRLIYPMI